MGFRRMTVSYFLRAVVGIICKIDCREAVEKLAKNKPMLVVFNHVNFLEVPAIVAYCYPTYITGLAKVETWKNPFFAFLFNTYKAIPIDRVGAFSEPFRRVRETIENGYHMIIAPEGTRSRDGVLGQGKAGVVQLALEADLQILPVAHHGGENIWKNLKRFKRTPFCFKAGSPFKIKLNGKPGQRPNKSEREQIISEIMGQMAKLLPVDKRGMYTEQAEQECKYLDFINDTHL